MATDKRVSLTHLFAGLRYSPCLNPTHHHDNIFSECQDRKQHFLTDFVKIADILGKKDATLFSYVKHNHNALKPSLKDFYEATNYTYDENTLCWIIYYERRDGHKAYNDVAGPLRKNLIQTLATAGIIENTRNVDKSIIVTNLTEIESDENIFWLMDIGLVPNEFFYGYYGCRTDRTFEQKLAMFKLLHKKYHITPHPRCIWENCFKFSTNLKEITEYIKFFLTIITNSGTDDLFIYGFEKIGITVFPILRDFNLTIDDPIRVIRRIFDANHSQDDNQAAFAWLSDNYPNVKKISLSWLTSIYPSVKTG